MMKFLTPVELERHLAELVDDEEFILRTVRATFPEYKREVRQRMKFTAPALMPIPPVKAPPPAIEMYSASEGAWRRSMKTGSRDLLTALWRSHAPILEHRKANGGQVEHP